MVIEKGVNRRLRELDFLRGLAVVLVIFRHQHLFSFTTNIGWIGVDLFFVLSGFLISGLLFKEYIKFGNIEPKRFLIRRGFKIYPIYYIFFGIYFILRLIEGWNISGMRLLPELIFAQNYVVGSVYVMPVSWSLAVEEHFYFGLALLLWWGTRSNRLKLANAEGNTRLNRLEIWIIASMIVCPVLRMISNLAFPEDIGGNTRMTHLRIDSLLAGVLVSYWYYFKRDWLQKMFRSRKYLLLALCITGLIWTPFLDLSSSFFVKTIGFSLLYISFGIVLICFLLAKNINHRLDSLFSSRLVNAVSKIGFCSYSIYIIHIFVILLLRYAMRKSGVSVPPVVQLGVVMTASIAAGFVMTYKLERFFLAIRDNYFPARTAVPIRKAKKKEITVKASCVES